MITIWKRQGMVAAACGLGFLALFGAGFIVFNVFVSEPYPSVYDPGAEIERFVAENRSEVRVVGFFFSLAAALLLVFAAFLAALVRRSAGEMGALPELTLGGGVVAAAFLLLSALGLWVLGREATAAEPALVRALHDLVYLAGGPAHVVSFAAFLGPISVAARRSRVLPGWIAWLGGAAAALSLLSVTALLWEPAAYVLPLARLLTYAWIFAVGVALVLGWPREAGAAERGAVGEAFRVGAEQITSDGGPAAGARRSSAGEGVR